MRRMRTDEFDFELPQELMTPASRGTSRMLVLEKDTGRLEHREIGDLAKFLRPDDLLLLNDTRVIPARLFAHRPTGRKFEILLLRKAEDDLWEALLRPSARARSGERLQLADGGTAIPEDRHREGRWSVRFDPPLDLERLDVIGEMPLPPYIRVAFRRTAAITRRSTPPTRARWRRQPLACISLNRSWMRFAAPE